MIIPEDPKPLTARPIISIVEDGVVPHMTRPKSKIAKKAINTTVINELVRVKYMRTTAFGVIRSQTYLRAEKIVYSHSQGQ